MSEANAIVTPDEKLVEYRSVPDFPGYRAGSDGSVWSHKQHGRWRNLARIFRNGYPMVCMYKNGVPHVEAIHRIVLLAFVGPAPEGMHGCHNNSIRDDCRIENLRWDTPKGNHADKIVLGRTNHGTKHHLARFSDSDVIALRSEYAAGGVNMIDLAARLNVSMTAISCLLRGKTWRHIGGPIVTTDTSTGRSLGGKRGSAARYAKFIKQDKRPKKVRR